MAVIKIDKINVDTAKLFLGPVAVMPWEDWEFYRRQLRLAMEMVELIETKGYESPDTKKIAKRLRAENKGE